MKFFVDGQPIEQSRLTYREMGSGGVPVHLRHAVRIELERDELVALLGAEYQELVEELREDIANTGNPSESEQAALDHASLDEFLQRAPDQFDRLLDVYLWGDLVERLFGKNDESQWEFVVDKLETVSIGQSCRIFATAYPVRPFGSSTAKR